MQTMTSAYANKMLKSLEEDKRQHPVPMLQLSMRNLSYQNMIIRRLQLLLHLLMRKLQLSSMRLM